MEYSTSQMKNQKETGSKEMVTKEEEINDRHSTIANAADPRNRSEKFKRSIGYAKVEISPAEVKNTDCQEPVKPLKQEPSKSESSCTVVKKEEVSDILGTLAFHPYTPVDRPVSLATSTAPVVSAKSKSEEYDDGCSGDDVEVKETGPSKQRHVEVTTIDVNECDGGLFTCLDCAAVFKTKVALKRHIASHPGYRRFKCSVCEKRFTRSVRLTQHSRQHTGERPFKCDICEKKFALIASLQRHRRIHTDESFECDACEKKFTSNYGLTAHKRSHTGERPFKCLICTKGFVRNGDLQIHKRIHSDEKPYICMTCGLCFRRSCHLQQHKLKQHTDHNANTKPDVSHLQQLIISSLQADASTETSVMEDCIVTEKV